MRAIALITDFGTADGYVGEMKAVLLDAAPAALPLDVTHDVPPGDVEAGAWVLGRLWGRMPPGTVHLTVVDPGVGSERRAVVAEAGGRWFVGPDNGLLTRVLGRWPAGEARRIDPAAVATGPVSDTFHGRDLFAPAAARLATGDAQGIGPPIDPGTLARLRLPAPRRHADRVEAPIAHVDRFGNLVTDLPAEWLPTEPVVEVGGRAIRGLARSYAARVAERGPLVALVGSGGTLEVAVAGGSAAGLLKVGRGDAVVVRAAATGRAGAKREGADGEGG